MNYTLNYQAEGQAKGPGSYQHYLALDFLVSQGAKAHGKQQQNKIEQVPSGNSNSLLLNMAYIYLLYLLNSFLYGYQRVN